MDTLDILTLILSFIAIAVSYYSVKTIQKIKPGEQLANITDLLNKEYIFGDFKDQLGNKCEEINTLRKARNEIKEFEKNEETQEDLRLKYNKDAKDPSTWEGAYAYKASLVLNQLGLNILTGAVPARVVFPIISDTIIRDWENCQPVISKIRKNTPWVYANQRKKTSIVRIHAQWLAFASVVYILEHWEKVVKKNGEDTNVHKYYRKKVKVRGCNENFNKIQTECQIKYEEIRLRNLLIPHDLHDISKEIERVIYLS